MSSVLCKSLLFGRCYSKSVKNPFAYCNPLSLRWLSSVRVSPNELSFTVSYLINSLGFSVEASKIISKHVSFKTRTKPDKTIDFLRNFGFSQTQILNIVRARPDILVMDTKRTLLPKLESLESKGISRPELSKSLSFSPTVLRSSLDKQIIPTFGYLRTLLPSEASVAVAVKGYPNILTVDFEKCMKPNVSTLLSHGVPKSNVVKCILLWSKCLYRSPVRFQEAVEEVAKMGFNPLRVIFLTAVRAKVSKANWENKVNMYKKRGWSDNDILKAFCRDPCCMHTSKDRFTSVMDFFIFEMGLKPCDLANCSMVFKYNLKKRVIPRALVLGALVSKGLMKKQVKLYTVIQPTEKVFLRRYVTPYADIAPELLKLYKEGNEIGTFERFRQNLGAISELM